MAMLIPQQGSGFPFFSTTSYNYLRNSDISHFKVIPEDVTDPEVRAFLEEVHNTYVLTTTTTTTTTAMCKFVMYIYS